MVALLVTAAIVAVMLPIVVQESGFPTNWTGWIIRIPLLRRCFRRPLMSALFALVLLVTMEIFSIAIKVRFVVALRAA